MAHFARRLAHISGTLAKFRNEYFGKSVPLKYFRHAFFQHANTVADAVGVGELAEPAGRLVHVLERKPESAVVHGNQPLRVEFLKNFYGNCRFV